MHCCVYLCIMIALTPVQRLSRPQRPHDARPGSGRDRGARRDRPAPQGAAAPGAVDLLRGKTLAMLFEKPRLRTRVSFEVGMTQLGGQALIAADGLSGRPARDARRRRARASRFGDAIVVRTHAHEPLQRFAPRRPCRRSTGSPPPRIPSKPSPTCSRSASASAPSPGCGSPTSATAATTSRRRWRKRPRCAECPSSWRADHASAADTFCRTRRTGQAARHHGPRVHSPVRAVRDVESSTPTCGPRWARKRSSSATPPQAADRASTPS